MPDVYTILLFSLYTALYNFSSVGVSGGGIIILYPVLVHVFGYSTEMLNMATSLYILLDMFGTTGNIIFNNLLSVLLHYLYKKI